MAPAAENALIIQSDCSVLLEVNSPRADEARAALAPFAELVKSPEHVHTYRLTPLSIWNARATGLAAERMVTALREHTRYPVPSNVEQEIFELAARYGRVVIVREGDDLRCTCQDLATAERIARDKEAGQYLARRIDATSFRVDPAFRGVLKQALVGAGYPAEDLAGYVAGEPFDFVLARNSPRARAFKCATTSARPRRHSISLGRNAEAVKSCSSLRRRKNHRRHGCDGPGEAKVLVLTTSLTSVNQWRRELLDKTSLRQEDIADYTGEQKNTGPVTLTTYQILTWRADRDGEFPHLELFRARPWGLIIYDEVHLLPAPVFQITADLQARRRLGLTATLIREDGRESDVFALIGPKRFDVPWKDLERQAWIAAASCIEIRVPMSAERRMEYALAERRHQFRVAAENPAKRVIRELLGQYPEGRILVIGEYIDQVTAIAKEIGAPLVMGKTPQAERERIYKRFRNGEFTALCCRRWGTSPSTFQTPMCSSKYQAPSAPVRRRRSGSDASSAQRMMAAPRISSR